jgi:hypothetical protein
LGTGQAVEVVEHLGAGAGPLEVELAAAAQFEQEQTEAPPQQEACGVGDRRRGTRVGDVVQPGVEKRPEVADGLDQQRADVQDRPFLRLRS